jgi:hypothetical protein
MKREDVNWRKLNLGVALEVYKAPEIKDSEDKALVADDSVKERRGKIITGVSRHFNHYPSRSCMRELSANFGISDRSGIFTN